MDDLYLPNDSSHQIDVSLPPIPPPLMFEDLTEEQFNSMRDALNDFIFACQHRVRFVIDHCKDPVVKQHLIDYARIQ